MPIYRPGDTVIFLDEDYDSEDSYFEYLEYGKQYKVSEYNHFHEEVYLEGDPNSYAYGARMFELKKKRNTPNKLSWSA